MRLTLDGFFLFLQDMHNLELEQFNMTKNSQGNKKHPLLPQQPNTYLHKGCHSDIKPTIRFLLAST